MRRADQRQKGSAAGLVHDVEEAPASERQPLRVAMLVRNSGEFDTRVRKEALAVARRGHDVRVFAIAKDGLPVLEQVGTVVYERVTYQSYPARIRARLLEQQEGLRHRYLSRVHRARKRRQRRAAHLRSTVAQRAAAAAVARQAANGAAAGQVAARQDSTCEPDHGRTLGRPGPAVRPAAAFADASSGTAGSAQRESGADKGPDVVRGGVAASVPGFLLDAAPTFSGRLPASRRLPAPVRRVLDRARAAARWRLIRARRRLTDSPRRLAKASIRRLVRVAVLFYRRTQPLHYHRDYRVCVTPALREYRPNIVHCHDLNTLDAGRRYAREHGTVLIYDAHELELHRNAIWTRMSKAVAWITERRGVAAADRVITVSPAIADDLARMYRCPRPAVVLNAPPIAAMAGEPVFDLRSVAALGKDERLVVYVGAVTRGRGLDVMVEALVHAPPTLHVGVLGPANPVAEGALLEQAAQLSVLHRLHIFGSVPAARVPATLRTADAFVNPAQNICRSYDLALPNKLFDAVLAGVPIGVGRLQELSRFVRTHEIGVVFDETSPADVARGMMELVQTGFFGLEDAERLEALRREVAWERQEIVLNDLYHDLEQLATRHRGAAAA